MIILLCLFAWASNASLVATGEVFEPKEASKKFSYERYQKTEGDLFVDRSIYKNSTGQVVAKEHMERLQGKLVSYEIEQKQTKQKAKVSIKGDKVVYSVQNKDGKIKTKTHSLPKNFIVTLELLPFIQKHWESLKAGKTIDLKLAVWKRKDHFSFFIKKIKSPSSEIVFKMQPTNIIIRALVKPMYFVFDAKTKNIKSYKGPLNLKKIKPNGKLTDFDGKVYYKLL